MAIYAHLRERAIQLIASDSPHTFVDDTPMPRLVRQVLGAIAEFGKAMTVAKLKGAQDRPVAFLHPRGELWGKAKIEAPIEPVYTLTYQQRAARNEVITAAAC